jgi:hypothetical protein
MLGMVLSELGTRSNDGRKVSPLESQKGAHGRSLSPPFARFERDFPHFPCAFPIVS